MTRLLVDKDFAEIGRGHKISYVNVSDNDIRVWCPHCKKWTFHKLVRNFSLNGVWKGVYQCKECE